MKKNQSKRMLFSLIAFLLILLVGGGIRTYNDLAMRQNDVDTKWAQVENVMQRRADLIPNLVSSVKGSMKQEEKVFGQIADARKQYNNASTPKEKIAANEDIEKGLNLMINVIKENYPQLTSNENVKTLMTQLEGTENRISVERKNYIEEVNQYNKRLVRFPKNIYAKLFGFERKANFKGDARAQEVPRVNLD